MVETGTPVVFVLMAGSAIAFDGLEKQLPALLMAWYPGQRGGDAVADVLFGKYNPAGRLPVTFYKSTSELADFSDYNMRAGKGFTYRYYIGDPLYAFGHGLSYTEFEYSKLETNKSTLSISDSLTVNCTINNTGEFDGDEVVQLYVRQISPDKPMPVKQLRNFERITIPKGKNQTVTFTIFPENDFRYYNSFYEKYMVDPGQYEIQIGASSSDIRLTQIVTVQ